MNQEKLKELKSSAKVIARELQSLGYPPIAHTQMLAVLSKSIGFESWNALRAGATVEEKGPDFGMGMPLAKEARYPAHFIAATYAGGEFIVDVVKWEDPRVGLGYGYYAYDRQTGRCLTPTAPFLFGIEEVPTYEQVRALIEALEYVGECSVCHYVSEENEGLDLASPCHKPGCTGHIRPFLNMFD